MKYYENFLGFRFGEYHSRDLGLYRVSDGDRYNDVSIPAFSDTTSKIPGGDGTYYWDSFYNQRTFTINTAFDNLSETQLRQIRQIFNGKAEDWLILDEVPYKKYRVKVQSPPQIKYHSFREDPVYDANWNRTFERPRVYKGEIVFQFVSYYPYGIDNFKTVPFNEKNSGNLTEACYTSNINRSILVNDPDSTHSTAITIPTNDSISVPISQFGDFINITTPGTYEYVSTEFKLIHDGKMYGLGSDGTRPCKAILSVAAANSISLLCQTSNGSFFATPVSAASSESVVYTKTIDKWDRHAPGTISSTTYSRNPWHYYTKQTNLYISNYDYSTESVYYTPDLYKEGDLYNSYKNADEWYDSAKLLSDRRYRQFLEAGAQDSLGAGYFVYNPGDLPTDVKIIINKDAIPFGNGLDIVLKRKNTDRTTETILGELYLGLSSSDQVPDSKIVIDTAKNLVYGLNSNGEPTGTLYNKYITSGAFFKLPITQDPLTTDTSLVDYCDFVWINIPKSTQDIFLDYNYLYY